MTRSIKEELLTTLKHPGDKYFSWSLTEFKFWHHLSNAKQQIKNINLGNVILADTEKIVNKFNHYLQSFFAGNDELEAQRLHTDSADRLEIT